MAKRADGHPDPAATNGQGAAAPADPPADEATESNDELLATAATVGVVAVGALVFEAALLPGIVLGVCAMLAPKALPKIGGALNPLFKSTVRGAYVLSEKTKEMVAEMQEQVHDIVAEVKSEADAKADAPKPPGG
ncbi:MAG TPA: DUF5132 domain-containing protein [Xanthobacteraceae bacterium]|nr:DUF5132 domain-containing protein [Xanthobacteraceae bacterium]